MHIIMWTFFLYLLLNQSSPLLWKIYYLVLAPWPQGFTFPVYQLMGATQFFLETPWAQGSLSWLTSYLLHSTYIDSSICCLSTSWFVCTLPCWRCHHLPRRLWAPEGNNELHSTSKTRFKDVTLYTLTEVKRGFTSHIMKDMKRGSLTWQWWDLHFPVK